MTSKLKLIRLIVWGIVLFAFVSITAFGQATNAASPPATGASKVGTAIGTTLSTALSTAFPGISAIINAIWPASQTGNKNKAAATMATDPLQKASSSGLQQLVGLSAQLDTVTAFFASCMAAENNVVALTTFLVGKKSPLSDADNLQAQNYWNYAESNVTSLKNTDALVNQLTDPEMQATFRAVAAANKGLISNITGELKSKAPNALDLANKDLATLNGQLAAVNALSGEVINDISIALKSATAKAAGGQGLPQPSQTQLAARNLYNKTLASRYSALK